MFGYHSLHKIMDISPTGVIAQCKLRQCSRCPENTIFRCTSCHQDLCKKCKEEHVIDLDTKEHDVVIYHETFSTYKIEICAKHPDSAYEKFCLTCQVPFCFQCTEHNLHRHLDIKQAYEEMRQQHREIINTIRSEKLYIGQMFQTRLKLDVESDILRCQKEINRCQIAMSIKGEQLKNYMESEIYDFGPEYNEFLRQRLRKQKIKMARHLENIEIYEYMYERCAYRPTRFLTFVKRHSFSERTKNIMANLSVEFLTKFLSHIRRSKTKKRHVDKSRLLTIMSTPVVDKYYEMAASSCRHFSVCSSENFWISDQNQIVLTNLSGDILKIISDIYFPPFLFTLSNTGLHTVTRKNDLIYIDEESNITKFSAKEKTKDKLIGKSNLSQQPVSIYFSMYSGDVLVGMNSTDSEPGMVSRYNDSVECIQTIQYKDNDQILFSCPIFITENNNRDIVVSDATTAVVVTDQEGRDRFSYNGAPIVSTFSPLGLCTDRMSNILVCDEISNYVHIVDLNGQLLKNTSSEISFEHCSSLCKI